MWFCSCFIELIKGYGVFNIAHLNNLARGLNMLAVDHQKQGMLQYLMAKNQWVKSVVLALNSDPARHRASIKTPLPKIHQNSSQEQPKMGRFYFSEDHKYTCSFPFLFGPLSQNNFNSYFLLTSSGHCSHLGLEEG